MRRLFRHLRWAWRVRNYDDPMIWIGRMSAGMPVAYIDDRATPEQRAEAIQWLYDWREG